MAHAKLPDLLPGQLVRLAVSLGLVIWLSRLRDRLVEAQRLARIDSLTGLPNRQALIDSLQAELSRSRRFARPFSLAMLDWDGFKKINDQQGHLVGDEVLRRVGVSLREHTRPFDCAGRWGGDEFLVVLSEVDGEDAKLIAERLRASIRHYVERDFPSLAFSLGVVTFQNAELDWPSCVARADATMYAAKRQGRDQTRFEIFHLNGSNPKQAPYPAKPTATASAVINPANADLGASNPNANNPTKAIIGNAANTVDKNGEPTAS